MAQAMKTLVMEFDSSGNPIKLNGAPYSDNRVGKMTTMPADTQYQQFADPLRVTVYSVTVSAAGSGNHVELGDADGNSFPITKNGSGTWAGSQVVASSDNGELMITSSGSAMVVVVYSVERF